MAKYRQVHTTFWQDPKVLEEMTPEDKYFYLYILTNPNTTQIGVYQITRKQMAFDLGYSTESINSLLDRFINNHKILKYNDETRELAVINWGKYNFNKAGKPVIDCVKKELKEVKDKTLLWELMNHITNKPVLDEFSRYVYDTCDDTSTIGGQEEEEEKEEEKENNMYSQEFEVFWNIYPNKKDKKGAYEKFKQAVKRHSVAIIMKGATDYARECEIKETEKRYIKHPKTFLHNDSFLDEFETTKVNIGTHNKQNRYQPKAAVIQPKGIEQEDYHDDWDDFA